MTTPSLALFSARNFSPNALSAGEAPPPNSEESLGGGGGQCQQTLRCRWGAGDAGANPPVEQEAQQHDVQGVLLEVRHDGRRVEHRAALLPLLALAAPAAAPPSSSLPGSQLEIEEGRESEKEMAASLATCPMVSKWPFALAARPAPAEAPLPRNLVAY